MEELTNLQNVQTMLSYVEESGMSSNDHHSDRFLAEFMLFMAKPSANLTMEDKCKLISQHLPKISPSALEQAKQLSLPPQVCLESKNDLDALGVDGRDMAMIGLDAMQRANSTLEDFCRFYFMFHGLDVKKPEVVFKYLPMLSFTESYIYQLDSFNEQIVQLLPNEVMDDAYKPKKNYGFKERFSKVFRTNPFGPLTHLLEHHGLMTERIRAELKSGEEYWLLERKLCTALVSKQQIMIEDVMRAVHLKSFDYRVLNLLLYQLRLEQVDDMHMEFLSTSEFLVEVSDDLFDYEEDVVENSFNILRMFVGVYGASVAPAMLARCISEAEEKYERLSKSLDENLSLNCWRRCEEATREGGKISGHSFGTWNIPTVIADEELYRSDISTALPPA